MPDDLAIGHLLAAQEHAFRQLATDLHDGPVQDVIAAQFLVAAMGGDEAATSAVQAALQGVTDALRATCQMLYAPALEPFGLFKAVESAAEKLASGDPAVAVTLDLTGDDQALPPGVQQQVYRIIQELLINVARHAQAAHATVCVTVSDAEVEMQIADDGVGIASELDAAACAQLARNGQYGLLSSMLRAQALGGELRVAPGAESGTIATLTVARRLVPSPFR